MNKTLLEQAIADANSISTAAEEVAKKKLLESLAPEIKRLVNQKLLMEEDDKSAEKLADEDEIQAPDTLAQEPAPEQMISSPTEYVPTSSPAVTSEPVPAEIPASEPGMEPSAEPIMDVPQNDVPVEQFAEPPVSETPTSSMPSEDPAPASMPTDVPMSDFDDQLVIELKPLIDSDGGIQDLPVEEAPEQSTEPTSEVDSSLKEAFMKRDRIKTLLESIPELKDDDAPLSLSDIPDDEVVNEDVNICISVSSSDGSDEDEKELDFLKDSQEGEVDMDLKEKAFVEEALKIYRSKKNKKKAAKKGSIKEFYNPEKKGFKYGERDTDPEADSKLFPHKRNAHFDTVLPPDVKKWMVEAHKTLNEQAKKLNEQAILNHQMRLLVKCLRENKVTDEGFLKLVESLDSARSIKESNNTFARFLEEEFQPVKEPEVTLPDQSAEKDDAINEALKRKFKKLAQIND